MLEDLKHGKIRNRVTILEDVNDEVNVLTRAIKELKKEYMGKNENKKSIVDLFNYYCNYYIIVLNYNKKRIFIN